MRRGCQAPQKETKEMGLKGLQNYRYKSYYMYDIFPRKILCLFAMGFWGLTKILNPKAKSTWKET